MEINILVVDDSKSILLIVEDLLGEIDANLIINKASSGQEALEIVANRKIDFIILDIYMPNMDGFEVARILKSKKESSDIPIVFLTASTKLKTEGLEIGAVDYLIKPIDADQFISRISLYIRLVKAIKENRQKDQQLMHSTRLAQMGEMISMIAHQWRQPLASISAMTGNTRIKLQLRDYDFTTQEGIGQHYDFLEDTLKKIENNVQNLSTTINDFRDFYKPNKEPVKISLESVTRRALDIIKPSLTMYNIELIEEYKSNEEIELYDNEIVQVILNIVKNAEDNFLEHSTIEDPKIIISVLSRSIKICDNGGGIEKEIIDKIFDPYFSTKKAKNGTGLGLYMSKLIIEDHHSGYLGVENSQNGVCFSIELVEL